MPNVLNPRYQYDPTGYSPDNLIVEELHQVPLNGARIIVAREGVFYTHELSLVPAAGGPALVLGQDYHFVSIDHYITTATGLETGTAIEFDNDSLFGDFLLTYHAVGGVEGNSNALVADLIEAIELSQNAGVDWRRITNVPAQFPPAEHLHSITGLTELEVVSQAIDRLTEALMDSRPLVGSALALKYQDERILALIAALTTRVNELTAQMQDYVVNEIERITRTLHQVAWAESLSDNLGYFYGLNTVTRTLEAHTQLGDENLTWAVTGGSLPNYLTLDPATGVLSGTAPDLSTSNSYEFRVRVDDGFNAIARVFTIEALAVADSIDWITQSNLSAYRGAVNFTLLAVDSLGGTVSYTLVGGALPAGWTLSSGGQLVGTATDDPSVFTFTVQARTVNGVKDRNFTLYFIEQPYTLGWDPLAMEVLPFIDETSPVVLPTERLPVDNTIFTGEEVIDSQLVGDVANPDNTSDIVVDDSLDLTVLGYVVEPNGAFVLNVSAHSLLGDENITYAVISGNLPPGLSLDPSGFLVGQVPEALANTTYSFTINANDTNDVITRTFSLTVVADNDAPVFTGASDLGVLVGNVNIDLSAIDPENQPVTSNVISGTLPPGLTLTSNGLLIGTVDATGLNVDTDYSFVVESTDGVNTVTATYTARVLSLNAPPVFTVASDLGTLVGAVNIALTATDPDGNPVTHAVVAGSLPPGLNLDSNGILAGVIDNAGVTVDTDYSFTVSASDGQLSATRVFNLTVPRFNSAPYFTTGPDFGVVVGGVNLSVEALDPEGDNVTHTITSGSLPPGVTMDQSAQLTGFIDNTGVQSDTEYNFTVSATDGVFTTDRTFTITVPRYNTAPYFTIGPDLGNMAGVVSLPLAATDDENDTLTYRLLGGTLPAGTTITQDGILSGTINADENTYTFSVEVDDGTYVDQQTFTLVASYGTIFGAPDVIDGTIINTPITASPGDQVIVDTVDLTVIP